MIEEIIITYLNSKLTVPCYAEVPSSPPDAFVVVEKTAGDSENFIFTSTVAVQSYGATLHDAAELNETVKQKMFDLVEESSVSKVTLNSNYNYTDTSTKRYRYQAVFDIVHF